MKQIEFYAKHQKKGLMISKTMRSFSLLYLEPYN